MALSCLQIHNRITALTAVNGNLDEIFRRKSSLLSWTCEMKGVLTDVKQRPARLRTESVHHDINQVYIPPLEHFPSVNCFNTLFYLSQLSDIKQSVADKQSQVDDMEMQLMNLAPDSAECVSELRSELTTVYEEVMQDIIFKRNP